MIRPLKSPPSSARYRSFGDFYPFYVGEHANTTSRRLHVIGTGLALGALAAGLLKDRRAFLLAPILGYGFAWVGHVRFEKNRPATFQYPLYSLMGDIRLAFETLTGRRAW